MVLKDCDSCLVYGTDNRPLAKARVEIMDDDRILLFFQFSKLRSIRIKTFVDFHDRQYGVVRCHCDLIIQNNRLPTKLAEPWMAQCTILKVQDTFQRQKDLRVDVGMKAEFTSLSTGYFSGTIQNISAGGIFLLTSHVLKKNERFQFSRRLEDEMVRLEARVVRIGPLVKGEYSYGCQFVGITLEAEAAVRKFVYKKQKERQNRLGKRA